MNQIARGGYSLTPPEGGTTGVPLASGVRGQTPPSSSTLPGEVRTADAATLRRNRNGDSNPQQSLLQIETSH